MSAACIHCDGWGCTHCRPLAQRLAQASGEQGLTAEELDVVALRNRVRELDEELLANQILVAKLVATVKRCEDWLPPGIDVECPDEKADLIDLRAAIRTLTA